MFIEQLFVAILKIVFIVTAANVRASITFIVLGNRTNSKVSSAFCVVDYMSTS